MNLGSVPMASVGSTYLNATTEPGGKPGMQAWSRDGRRFRLVKNSAASDIGAGRLMQGQDVNPAHTRMPVLQTVFRGARSILLMAGASVGSNVPANTYAGGLVYIDTGPSACVSFGVRGHNAIVASQPFVIELESDDLIYFPLIAGETMSLVANPYVEAFENKGSNISSGPIGCAVGSGIPAGLWGFVQVEGLVVCAADSVVIPIGQSVSPSITVNGFVTINSGTLPIIGSAVGPSTGVHGSSVVVSINLP